VPAPDARRGLLHREIPLMKTLTKTESGSTKLRKTLETLLQRVDLSHEEAERTLLALADPDGSPTLKAAVLAALRAKGESATELAAVSSTP